MDSSKYRARRSVDGLTGSAGHLMVRRSGHRDGRRSQAVDPAKDRGNNQLGVTANREVSAEEVYKLDAKVIDLTGTDSITLTVGQSWTKIGGESVTLVSADGQRIKLN